MGIAATLAGIGALAGLVYLPVWLHREDPPPPSLTKKPSEVILVDVPDTTLVGRHNGHRVWQIHARHIQSAVDGQTTTFVGIDRGTLYEHDRPAASMTAQKAVYNAAHRTLVGTGGFSVSSGGVTVRSGRLNWSAAAGRVNCPDPVTISWDGGGATARTLTADTRLRVLTGRDITMAARLEGKMFDTFARRLGAASGASLALFLAQTAPAQTAQSGTAAPVRYREVKVLRASLGRFEEATKTRILEGSVVIQHGDTTLKADKVVYLEGANTATITGHVTIDNPRNHVEGDTADVDFNTKLIHLRGTNGVKIVARPKAAQPGGKPAAGLRAQWKEPVTLSCRSIDYQYKEKRAQAAGPLTVTRKGQTLTGDSATYMAAQEVITLTGNVHGKDEKNQTFDAPSATISLKDGAEWMEAPNVRATFYVKDEEEAPAKTAAKP